MMPEAITSPQDQVSEVFPIEFLALEHSRLAPLCGISSKAIFFVYLMPSLSSQIWRSDNLESGFEDAENFCYSSRFFSMS